jgi:myo-inositol-1(or 4)-monophosphatase
MYRKTKEYIIMTNEFEAICSLVRGCGEIIRSADRGNIRIDEKSGPADFVTDYDKKVQDMLQRGLADIVPDAHFIGEEGSTRPFASEGRFFIVDPIDGTTNFIKDFHASAISVALSVDGAVELGVIYNPYLDELFTARRGCGAFCNGRAIHVSSESLENGIVIFGTSPYNEEVSEKSFRMAYEYHRRALDVRRTGSAAIDLCNIAAGRAELFFELVLSPWDYAAGALIVEEAGGIVTDADGRALSLDRKCSVVARNAVVRPL